MATTQRSKYEVHEFKGGWAVIDTTSKIQVAPLGGEVITRTQTEEAATDFLARLRAKEKTNG